MCVKSVVAVKKNWGVSALGVLSNMVFFQINAKNNGNPPIFSTGHK